VDPKAPPLAVTDTHALIRAIDGNRKRLGKHARRMFDYVDEAKCAIYIPALALAELGEACHKNRVTLALPFEEWARAAFAGGKYHEAALTAVRARHSTDTGQGYAWDSRASLALTGEVGSD
jgi:PIN domain nuclease of toxin-antitoxin system